MSGVEEIIRQKLKEMLPERVIIHFFQQSGQSMEERIKVLQEVSEAAGLKVRIDLLDSQGLGRMGIAPLDEWSRKVWPQFFDELKACWPLGKVEDEVEAVRKLIRKYQDMARAKESSGSS